MRALSELLCRHRVDRLLISRGTAGQAPVNDAVTDRTLSDRAATGRPLSNGPRVRRALVVLALGGLAAALLPALAPAVAQAAPSSGGEFNYGEALQDSLFFYESQRSGTLPPNNRVDWRGNSDLSDGADHGVDLTGGYHDAGDEVKFGLPEAYSMAALAWGIDDNMAAYQKSGQLPYALSAVKWGDDYIIKAHTAPNVMYGQVGDGSTDHAFWGPAEVNPTTRKSYSISTSCPGSELAGEGAAALAASSIAFKTANPSYAATLISQAVSLYSFADTYRGKYDACIPANGFYTSFSGYWDELVWGALWLYKATGDASYLTKAENYFPNMQKTGDNVTPEYAWTVNWDDTSFASYVLLAQITGQQQYVTDAERNLDWFTTGVNGAHVKMSPGGEAQVDVWGTARYAANEAFIAFEFSQYLTANGLDSTRATAYHNFAVQQINYLLGDNPNHESYEVGFTNSGTNTAWPQNIHNRPAHGSWANNLSTPAQTRHLDYGLLVGGPTSGDGFTDDRGNYQQTEGAIDYNALFTGDLANLYGQYGGTPRANFPPPEATDGPEEYVTADVNVAGANFVEIKADVFNKSAWPARHLTGGTLRYYFTLDPGETASQLQFSSAYNQCATPAGATQWSGSIYYVTIDCTGQDISPSGQSPYTRQSQFRIIFPAAHDYTKDWSFQGIPSAAGAPEVNAGDIELWNGGTRVWGTGPAPQVNPPSAPGTPTASSVTPTSATLSWPAATAGTNPISSYTVYQLTDTASVKLATVSASTTSYPLTGLTPLTAQAYDVVAEDSAGLSSTPSAGAFFPTPQSAGTTGTPPSAPTAPTVSNVTQTSATLSWSASTPGSNAVAGYSVYSAAGALVATVTAPATSYGLTGLSPGTAYGYYIVATDALGNVSPASSPAAFTTQAGTGVTPPSAPGTPVASNATQTSVSLSWAASTAGTNPIAGYTIYEVAGSQRTQVATVTTTSAVVTGLQPATTYGFEVAAADTQGNASAMSPAVSVTTSPAAMSPCLVTYATQSEWAGGFTANVTISNTGAAAINGWTLTFTFAGDQKVTSFWNTQLSQTGENVTATNVSYNATITPTGAVSFGLQGTWINSDNPPTSFQLNGVTCTTG